MILCAWVLLWVAAVMAAAPTPGPTAAPPSPAPTTALTTLVPTAAPTTGPAPSDSTNFAIIVTMAILGGVTLIVVIVACCVCANQRSRIVSSDYSSFQSGGDDIEAYMPVGGRYAHGSKRH